MARIRAFLSGLALIGLAGCSMAPAYRPPAVATAPVFKEAGTWAPADPAQARIPARWWAMYRDPVLDDLETRLDRDSPTLASALARYDAARAYLAQARAGQLPQLTIATTDTTNRQSDDRPLRSRNQPTYYGAFTLGGQADYDLDLWGRVRNTVRARRAEVQATADDLATIKLSLEAQLAAAYIVLRNQDDQAAMFARTVDAFSQANDLTERRFRGGIASGLDTARAGSLLEEAQAQLEAIHAARTLTEHAIASLIGQSASSFKLAPAPTALPLAPLPVGLPSTLLQRRPDIAAAEQRMIAANQDIGAAKAAFFPVVDLIAQGGFQSTSVTRLIDLPQTYWALGGSIVESLFDGGRRRAQLALARAGWERATADYRAQVLRAFQEVEDALSELHYLDAEIATEQHALTDAQTAEQISLNRYVKGAVSYLDVATAQTTALRVRLTLIALEGRRIQAHLRLVQALGGGWTGSA